MTSADDKLDAQDPRAELKYRLLLEISEKISHTLDLEAILSSLLQSVRSVIDYDAGGIFILCRNVPPRPKSLRSKSQGLLIEGMARIGFDDKLPEEDPMLRSGKGIVGHVIRTGEMVLARDVALDPHYVVGRATTRSEIAVPVVSNDQVIGALNFESDRLNAFSSADVEMLQFYANATAISIEKSMLHQELLGQQKIQQQLRIAREVQEGLMPVSPPVVPGYDIAAIYLPTWEVGGDYFDYIPLTGGRLGVVIADVETKGIGAALVMASLRAALRTALQRGAEIPSVVQDVNRILFKSGEAHRFATAFYGVLAPDGCFTYVNCGHNHPLLLHFDGACEALEKGGAPLGMFHDSEYESGKVSLRYGDVLALYTDGVVEVADDHDVQFGAERLRCTLQHTSRLAAHEMIRSVTDATREFADRDSYEDDFTLMILKRNLATQP